MAAEPNLEVIEVRKTYPGTVALKGVSLSFAKGEVHALIGKNGAGKSTLVKIISGAVQPDSGSIQLRGSPIELKSPRDAGRNGIATVYQELSLIPDLSVAHNMLLADLPSRLRGFIIDWKCVYDRAAELLNSLDINLDVKQAVRKLGVASRQMVEIAKAMAASPSVLLLDEPTSALARQETETLFRVIRTLSEKGVSIIYISHRLQELRQIAQKVSVLRDGELIGTIGIDDASPNAVAEMMFGEACHGGIRNPSAVHENPHMEVHGLSRSGRFNDISFTLMKGEILGIAGLLGSGRTELLRAISGADPFDSGQIRIDGIQVDNISVRKMKQLGVGLLPENRQEEGLVLPLSTCDNAVLASMKRHSWHGVLSQQRKMSVVQDNIHDLQIAANNPAAPVSSLSGGNQQKVVIAKWLNTIPQVLLCDEPTRGIDILARQQIFQLLYQLSAKGISTIFVSSELEELLEVCHRILIMQAGRITAEVMPAETTPQQLFEMCIAAS